jgi:hypothetical protein
MRWIMPVGMAASQHAGAERDISVLTMPKKPFKGVAKHLIDELYYSSQYYHHCYS